MCEASKRSECLDFNRLFALVHGHGAYSGTLHTGPAFLAGHSIYMRMYEYALNQFTGYSGALPFAAWQVR
jgi:7-keto-8-aminopelargonate synthetase-like enzyme